MANVNVNVFKIGNAKPVECVTRTGECTPETCEVDTQFVPLNPYVNNPKGGACCKFYYIRQDGWVDRQFYLDRGFDAVWLGMDGNKKVSYLVKSSPCPFQERNLKCTKYEDRSYSCRVGPTRPLHFVKNCGYKFSGEEQSKIDKFYADMKRYSVGEGDGEV